MTNFNSTSHSEILAILGTRLYETLNFRIKMIIHSFYFLWKYISSSHSLIWSVLSPFLCSQFRDLIISFSLFLMSIKNFLFIALVWSYGSLLHVLFAEFSKPWVILCVLFFSNRWKYPYTQCKIFCDPLLSFKLVHTLKLELARIFRCWLFPYWYFLCLFSFALVFLRYCTHYWCLMGFL